MAAILCRVCFVDPCKACASCSESCCTGFCKCCESCCSGFCKCMSSCCSAFSSCCDAITSCCDKPFSGCLIMSFLINLLALTYGLILIVTNLSSDQCGKPLLILAICLFVSAVINFIFSYYMYYQMNHNQDDEPPSTAKLWDFFKYDKWMAVYILFIIGMIVLLSISISYSNSCNSSIGKAVYWTSVILFIYLAVSSLILFSYVAFDAFREMAKNGYCWWIPCLWPCLCIGCLLNCTDPRDDDAYKRDRNGNRNKRQNKKTNKQKNYQYNAPQTAPPMQPVVVVHQPAPQQQVIVTRPPVQIQQQQPPPQQVVYTQPPRPQQTQPYAPQRNVNMNAAQPGILVIHQQQNQQQPQQQVHSNANDKNKESVVEYDDKVNALTINTKKVAKEVGVHAKKAGISAIGWMAKKMAEINDKVQDDKVANQQQQEGDGNANTRKY